MLRKTGYLPFLSLPAQWILLPGNNQIIIHQFLFLASLDAGSLWSDVDSGMAYSSLACPPQMLWQNLGQNVAISPIPLYSSPVKTAGSPVLPSPVSPFECFNGSPLVTDHNSTRSFTDSPAAAASYQLPPKAKRPRKKRCLNCEGCRRTENCGRCSVCTNPNATPNSICKNRRCSTVLKKRPSTLVSCIWKYTCNMTVSTTCTWGNSVHPLLKTREGSRGEWYCNNSL